MMIELILADDHALVRDGLEALLQSQLDMQVLAAVENGREAVRQVKEHCPDIVVMDINMPQLNGIDAALQIQKHCPHTKIIILSVHATSEHVFRALQVGVSGYLLKESAGKELIQAIHAVSNGQRYFCNHVRKAIQEQEQGSTHRVSPLNLLSSREREVLQLVVEGHTSAAIAKSLSLAPSTVETYRSRIMNKLGIDNLPGLVIFALRNGLISIE